MSEVLVYLAGDRYLDKRETAAYLSVSVRTLEGLPGLRRYRLNKAVRYRRSELDAWMQAHAETRESTPAPVGGLRGLLQASKKRALKEEEIEEKNILIVGHKG